MMHPSASERGLTDTLDKLQACRSAEERWLCGVGLLQACGSRWITAGTASLTRLNDIAVRSSTPGALIQDYLGEGLDQDDPWMQLCARGATIDTLDTGTTGKAMPSTKVRLASLFADHGVRHAVLVPSYGGRRTGGIVLYDCNAASDRWETDPLGLDRARLIVALFSAVYRPEADVSAGSGLYRFAPALTPREREVLLWLWSGHQTARIAERMGVQPVTVTKHLASVRRKLGARTREQALAIAMLEGLISI
jgi:DNA-binding CsgD family transcriptional regulator